MSIKAMTRVWDYSEQKGSRLLLLLAIADYAHDDGAGANPSTRTLARKTRMTQQNVMLLIDRCEASGELHVVRGRNRNSNQYTIVLREPTAKKILAQKLDNSSDIISKDSPLIESLAEPNYPLVPKTGTTAPPHPNNGNGRPQTDQQAVYEALVRVCLLPDALLHASTNDGVKKLKAQVGKIASTLVASNYTGAQVLACYSRNGWWWKEHWRGKDKHEAPTLGNVLKTIGEATAVAQPTTAWEDPAFVSRDVKAKQQQAAQQQYRNAQEEFDALASETDDERERA